MDTHPEDWNEIIDNGLSRELPGALPPELATRIEAQVERERALRSTGDHSVGLLLALFAAWLVLAASLITLHVSAAPGAYEALLAVSRSIIEEVRLDLITAAASAVLLTETAARLICRQRSQATGG